MTCPTKQCSGLKYKRTTEESEQLVRFRELGGGSVIEDGKDFQNLDAGNRNNVFISMNVRARPRGCVS